MPFGYVLKDIQISKIWASILKLVFKKVITLCDHHQYNWNFEEMWNKYI